MTDVPPGKWSLLLVGHQWPGSATLASITAASNNRNVFGTSFNKYAEQLESILSGPLANQEGVTADDAREHFQTGKTSAHEVASKNLVKSESLASAHTSTAQLRTELQDIAQRGNLQIEAIEASSDAFALKIGKIVDTVHTAQTEANQKAAGHGDAVRRAIQTILDREGLGTTAFDFAKMHGVNLDDLFKSPDKEAIRSQVTTFLDQSTAAKNPALDSTSSLSSAVAGNETSVPTTSTAEHVQEPEGKSYSQLVATNVGQQIPSQGFDPAKSPPTSQLVHQSQAGAIPTPIGSVPNDFPVSPSPVGTGTAITPATSQTGLSNASAMTRSTTSALTPASAFTPEGLAQNFNTGAQAGTPMSAGTEALSSNAMHAMQPQAPLHSEGITPPPVASTAPSSGMPLFENAHAATPVDTSPPPAPPVETTHTVVATPTAAPVMPSTPTAPPLAAGPLPAYGADLRPPAATIPASPPPMPSTVAGSAPVGPSAGSPINQPAVVRQSPTPAPTTTMAGLTENAFSATTAGASVGAGAAQTEARQRLQRLLDAVARQEPKLRWAIADRADGTTVLATDLASGWIPPHIDIPTGITLLPPEHRRPDLTAMLGETTLIAAHSPGQYIPAAEDAEPISTSIRARRTPDVDDLGWELAQATKWRDGLPRLAHTLAKVVATGTGYLDSEVELLREHLAAVTRRILTDYPDQVDSVKVGNWQLLATIDALINNEKTSANYHLAWFQTLNSAVRGEPHQ